MTFIKSLPSAYQKIPFEFRVALDQFPRYSAEVKFGFNPNVGSTQEDIWFAGGTLSYLSTAEPMNIASTSANDDGDPAGTGSQTIFIAGINDAWEEISETVTMNGMTDVLTSQSYLRVTRMYSLAVGSTGSNVGTITATAQTAGTVQAQIQPTENQTAKIQFSIPAQKLCLIVGWSFGVGGGSDAVFRFKQRPFGSGFRTIQHTITRRQADVATLPHPIVLQPRTDFTITGAVATGNPDCAAAVYYYLLDSREGD